MGRGALYSPHPLPWYFALQSKYLKVPLPESVYLLKLFVKDAPKKKNQKNSFTPSQFTLKYGSENRLWVRRLNHTFVGLNLRLTSLG